MTHPIINTLVKVINVFRSAFVCVTLLTPCNLR